jgi:hypothetical protein
VTAITFKEDGMSKKSKAPELRPPAGRRWYLYGLIGAAVVLAVAVGYYIGQQSEPAPASGPAVKKSTPTAAPDPKAAQPAKRVEKRGWITRITNAPKQQGNSSQTDALQTESGTGPDAQAVIAEVVAALDDPDPRVRERALERLEDMDDPAVNAALSKAIRDSDEDVREVAMDVMSFIGSPNIVDSLAEALSYGDANNRQAALEIAEDIFDPKTVEILIEKGLLNDNEEIQKDTFDALEALTEQEFTSYAEARKWWDQNRESFQFDD